MRETVERILDGKFDYEKGSLDFSIPRIELSLCPGEVYTGSFFVLSIPGHLSEGKVYSNDIRMKLITDSFSGTKTEIGYTFSSIGLEAGEVCQGEIYVISNQGEYYLPYVVTIKAVNIESSIGSIKNLFHFANLAKSDWNEAVNLFYSDDFINVFEGNDAQYKKVYLGLSRYYGNEQNVEEFLLSINKKQPIEYIVEENNLRFSDISNIEEEYINITRNGWGYTVLNVKTDSSFISFTKDSVCDSDFLGNYLSFPILINPEMTHGGLNFGRITFYNSFTSFTVDVTVDMQVATKGELSKSIEYKRAQYDMMTFYEAFRNHKISMENWIFETSQVVDRMLRISENNLYARLFKAQILMMEDRYNEAKWILDQAENEFQEKQDFTSDLWAYYLYLTTLYNREDSYIDEITHEINNLYSRDQGHWRMAWLLLYLSEEFAVSPTRKWLFIEQQIATGSYSPLFYVESVNMLVANPGLLSKLGNVELRTLRYAAENELLTDDLVGQFVYLADKEKAYSQRIFDILKLCYEYKPSDEIARVICEFLIKGDKKGPKYYEWYLYAINAKLRVTKLYEYFMESLDLNKEYDLPKMVYLYFSYDSELNWEHTAYLYSHIIAKRDEYPDVFESYKEPIRRFTIDEVRAGHINHHLALVYRYALDDVVLTEEMAGYIAKILFVHSVKVSNPNLTKVIVYQSRECVETTYPIEDFTAFVPLYNSASTILFEDNFSNRYGASVEYESERLMIPGKLATAILPYVHDNLGFDVYACECSFEMIEINEETGARYQAILDSPSIDASYKSEVRSKLMKYYSDNDRIRELDAILSNLEPLEMTQRERIMAERYMVARGMYDEAFDWVVRFGIEGIEIKDLVKLVSKLIIRSEYADRDDLTRVVVSVFFNGKYDEVILKYLALNYHGMTKDMRKIFKAAENFDVDIYTMCENMLVQMLYTGYYVAERMDIYKKYVRGGANTDIQNAFLARCAFEYFVKEQVMEPYVFNELTKAKLRNEPMQMVCKLAYIKFYSENEDEINETVNSIISEYIDDCVKEGIYMSFFKNFADINATGANKFSDRTVIEYKTDPGKRVFIHYLIEGDDVVSSEYVTEEMPDMFGGLHVKTFILFFGESLLYYITEQSDEEELLTESASIQKSDISRELNDSRFNEVNDIVIAKTLQDYDTVNKLIYEYDRHAYIVKRMFELQ